MTKRAYPRGKLNPQDEGALTYGVAVRQNTVIINFFKPILWLGLSAHDARTLAAKLIELADRIES